MFVAALLVLIVAVLLVIAALFGGNDTTVIDMGAFNITGSASLVFFAGMGTLLLFVLSLGMFRNAAKRASARRSDRTTIADDGLTRPGDLLRFPTEARTSRGAQPAHRSGPTTGGELHRAAGKP